MTDEVLKKILDIDGKVEIPFIVMKSLRKVRGFKVGDVITFDGNIPLNMKFKFNSLPSGGQKVYINKEEVLNNEWVFIQSGNDDCGALNIMRKVVGDSEIVSRIINVGRLFMPLKFNNLYSLRNIEV